MTPLNNNLVGFIIHDDIWLGGLNYLSNLLAGIPLLSENSPIPVLLSGTECEVPQHYFPGAPVLRTQLLDRKSLPWIIRKCIAVLLGRDLLLNRFLEQNGISVLSHSGHLGRHSLTPTIGWIPDLQHLHLPGLFTATQIRERNHGFSRLCALCTRIVVSSQCARADVEAFAPGSRDKIDVLSFVAVPPANDGRHTLEEMQQIYHFDGPYFLLPNQFWAHKNHRVVIDALGILKQRGIHVQVLATGHIRDTRNPTFFSDLMQHADKAGVLDRFRVLGVVPTHHLAVLMQHAVAFMNPSLFEGWSTSVEEAKSMGKQILLSNIPVHREQAPARGIFFEPGDGEALAEKLCTTLQDYDPATEALMHAEAEVQLPARLRAFALQYSNIVSKTLASPRRHAESWLSTIERKSVTSKVDS